MLRVARTMLRVARTMLRVARTMLRAARKMLRATYANGANCEQRESWGCFRASFPLENHMRLNESRKGF